MSGRTITELEQLLAGTDPAGPGPDLDLVRRRGRARRRIRMAAAAGSALALTAVAGVALSGLDGGPDRADDPHVAVTPSAPPRTGLTPLAERALAEIPGAERISPTKVLIPEPSSAEGIGRGEVVVHGTPVRLPEQSYAGVTFYVPAGFPEWLYDATKEAEMSARTDEEAFQVGTVDLTGVVVDAGERYLACITTPDAGELPDGVPCAPAVVTRDGGDWFLDWGMGSEDFLQPGAAMEVFTTDSTLDGADATLAIAGLDGTDVLRAEMIATDGTRTTGTVLAGSLIAGDTMIFGEVPGELARVVAYDAAGKVVEDHPLRDCDDPVDCEVR
jgi:hypothetical protein